MCGPDDDVEALKEEVMEDMTDIFSSVDKTGGRGWDRAWDMEREKGQRGKEFLDKTGGAGFGTGNSNYLKGGLQGVQGPMRVVMPAEGFGGKVACTDVALVSACRPVGK